MHNQQGDLFVNPAGNDSLEDTSKEKYLRRIAALDTATNVRASLSNFGPFAGVCSGTNIKSYSTTDTTTFVTSSGTSLASPSWVGAIALSMSLNPKLDAVDADKIVFIPALKNPMGL